MRLAWFSPLPPMGSGVSDYTTEIVPYVARHAEVDVFCPSGRFVRRVRKPRGAAALRSPDDYARRASGYDACFFHLGNNPSHEFVYEAARKHPAIAVFHETTLHHLVENMTMGRRYDPDAYERILGEELGERGARLANLRRRGVATDFERFVFPVVSRIARSSRGIVVHGRDAASRIAEHAPDVPIAVIPHHAGRPPASVTAVTRQEARRRLRIPQEAFVAGHFGFVTRPKQPAAVVSGFARLHAEFPDALLLMVGADRTGGALERMIDRHGLRAAVRRIGFVDLARFYVYLKAVDVVINLRYPTAGETSGTLARSLAEGRPVIVNNYGSWAELPAAAALKVEIDGPQGEQVGDHLLRLARDPELRRSLEEGARRYASAVLDPPRCAEMYVDFAARVGTAPSAAAAVPG